MAGFQCGFIGAIAIGLVEMPSLSPITIGLVAVAVLLFAWGWIKPLFAAVASKAKSLVPTFSTPPQSSVSERVALWEQLYEACDPEQGACPKARELLNEVFQHLAPYHPEAKK